MYKAPSKHWVAKLYHNRTSHHIGTFKTRAQARAAYDNELKRLMMPQPTAADPTAASTVATTAAV